MNNDNYIIRVNFKVLITIMSIYFVVFIISSAYIKDWCAFILFFIGLVIALLEIYWTIKEMEYVKIDKNGIHLAKWNGLKSQFPEDAEILHYDWREISKIEIGTTNSVYHKTLLMKIIFSDKRPPLKIFPPYWGIVNNKYNIIRSKVKLYSGNDLVLWVGTKIGEVAK